MHKDQNPINLSLCEQMYVIIKSTLLCILKNVLKKILRKKKFYFDVFYFRNMQARKCTDNLSSLMSRVFANDPEDGGFNPRSSHNKDSKKWYSIPPCLILNTIR